jgi:hypothetical protein
MDTARGEVGFDKLSLKRQVQPDTNSMSGWFFQCQVEPVETKLKNKILKT